MIDKPDIMHFEITDQCNMACSMCATVEHRGRGAMPYLTQSEIREKILVPGRQAGLEVLVISGGEPTLAPGLTNTVKDAVALEYRNIFLATNLLDRDENIYRELLAALNANRHAIQVSFDSINPMEMNAIRGKDVYERVLANCRIILALRERLQSKTLLSASLVIQKENVRSVIDTIHFILDELGFDLVLVQLRHDYDTPISAVNYQAQKASCDPVVRPLMLETTKRLFALAENEPRLHIEKGELDDWVNFLTDPQKINKTCTSTRAVFIDAFGRYRGCVMGEVLGNVRDTALSNYLKSEPYLEFVRFSKRCHICTIGCS